MIPKIDKTIVQMSNCALASQDDETVIALVVDDSEQTYTNVKKAWKVNLETENFVEIPTSKVTCDNVSYNGI